MARIDIVGILDMPGIKFSLSSDVNRKKISEPIIIPIKLLYHLHPYWRKKMKDLKTGKAMLILLAAVLLVLNSPPLFSAQKEQAAPQPQAQQAAAVQQNDLPGKLGAVVSKTPVGTEKGQFNPQTEKGFANIPGAPKINYVVAFLWAVWVGWIFATVGAFGGIMAGVGHMSLFALGAYAATFKTSNPELNKLLTDTIRASNQYLVGLAALISTWNFFKMKRLVVPLGTALGIGSLVGAMLITYYTADKLKFDQYQGWFGVLVLVIGALMLSSTTEKSRAKKKAADEDQQEAPAAHERKGRSRRREAALGRHQYHQLLLLWS